MTRAHIDKMPEGETDRIVSSILDLTDIIVPPGVVGKILVLFTEGHDVHLGGTVLTKDLPRVLRSLADNIEKGSLEKEEG